MYGGPVGLRRAPSATSTRSTPRRAARSRRCASCKPGRHGARHAHRPGARLRPAAVRDRASPRAPSRTSSSSRRRRGSRSSSSRPTPADEYQENLRNASTKNGSFDLVTTAIEEIGDFAEAGLLLPLDDYVDEVPAELDRPRVRLRRRRDHSQPVHAVQGLDLLRRVRQRHAAVLLPLRPAREPRRAGRVRGQVRSAARVPPDVGGSRRRSPSSSPGRMPTCRCTAT